MHVKLLALVFVLALLVVLVVPATAFAGTAQMSVYAISTGTASALNVSGHAWISVKNTSSTNLTVLGFSLKPGSELYLGTYGNLPLGNGLYWSREPYAATNLGESFAGRASLTQDVSSSQLTTLTSWVKTHNLWTLINNCSWFAAAAWNTVAVNKVSAGWLIPTPSLLKASIMSKTGWVLNKPWGTWGSSWGRYSATSAGSW